MFFSFHFLNINTWEHFLILKLASLSLIWQKQFPSLGFQWDWNEFACFCLSLSTKSSPNYAVSMPKHILSTAQLWKYHRRTTAGPQRKIRIAHFFSPLGKCKLFLTCSCWVERQVLLQYNRLLNNRLLLETGCKRSYTKQISETIRFRWGQQILRFFFFIIITINIVYGVLTMC